MSPAYTPSSLGLYKAERKETWRRRRLANVRTVISEAKKVKDEILTDGRRASLSTRQSMPNDTPYPTLGTTAHPIASNKTGHTALEMNPIPTYTTNLVNTIAS